MGDRIISEKQIDYVLLDRSLARLGPTRNVGTISWGQELITYTQTNVNYVKP